MTYYLVSPHQEDPDKAGLCYWMMDEGENWINILKSSVYVRKDDGDVILESVEAEDLFELDWKKTPLHNDELTSGWLSRNGRFYGCPSKYHDMLAGCVFGIKVAELERTGWVRVYSARRFTCETRISEEQRNWLAERGYRHLDTY